ncbi:MAG: hypothetical protein EXX96DRAFT_618766 [Benjaminiella poitrasii]|nr:MAG: hypothetical protein EXX96DRAFT_618766 [Benjaminiella poitrasii]
MKNSKERNEKKAVLSSNPSESSLTKDKKWRPAEYKREKTKISLAVFGSGIFGKYLVKLQENKAGVTGVFYRALKRREATGDLIVLTIDEYKTSRICNRYSNNYLASVTHIKGHGVLVCKTCNTLWQRDINASNNMMPIALSIWKGNSRPQAYSRK